MISLDLLLLLAFVQGVTEFLPVSSSAHLFLLTALQGFTHNPALDVMAHGGSVCGVMLYLRHDMGRLAGAAYAVVRGKNHRYKTMLLMLIMASLPAVMVGGLLHYGGLWQQTRTLEVVAMANIVFALLLYGADRFSMTVKKTDRLTFSHALTLGVAQCFAFIAGASRAGCVITAARLMGFERRSAAHLSLLMSIPIIVGAVILTLLTAPLPELTHDGAIVFIASFVVAWLAIRTMMSWLRSARFTIFVVYRLLLGGALLWGV